VSVSNQADGNRRVQVLRDHIVRNLPVSILGKVGTERVFVAGRFREGDEVIVAASRELADGTPVRPLVSEVAVKKSVEPESGKGALPAAKPKKPAVAF
jgi:hypothetical protein